MIKLEKKTEQVVCPNCRYVWYREVGKQITEEIAKEIFNKIEHIIDTKLHEYTDYLTIKSELNKLKKGIMEGRK